MNPAPLIEPYLPPQHGFLKKAREASLLELGAILPSSSAKLSVDLFPVFPPQQMSSLRFFQERCLRRCVQETVARRSLPVWQVHDGGLTAAVLFSSSPLRRSSLLQPAAAESSTVCSYITAAARWFMEHRSLGLDPGNMQTHSVASRHTPKCFRALKGICEAFLCAGKTRHWAVTYSGDTKTNRRLVILQLDAMYFISFCVKRLLCHHIAVSDDKPVCSLSCSPACQHSHTSSFGLQAHEQ